MPTPILAAASIEGFLAAVNRCGLDTTCRHFAEAAIRTLIVAPYYPLPIRSGGHRRIASLLRELTPRHSLHWLSLITPQETRSAPPLRGLADKPQLVTARHNPTWGSKAAEALKPSGWRRSLRRTADRMAGLPLDAVRMRFPEMASRLRRLLEGHRFDVVQIEYTAMGVYAPIVRRCSPRSRLILSEYDISSVTMQRRFDSDPEAHRLQGQIPRMQRFERRLWRTCDAVVTMSQLDRRHVAPFAGEENSWVVPNGVDPERFPFRERGGDLAPRLLFVGGMEHAPNARGLGFFLEEIWPLLKRRQADLHLDIVGEGAAGRFPRAAGEALVRAHGFVEDLLPILNSAALMVVPLLSGSGTRLKILEAFSAGLPVVSTTIGCEGIECRDGEHIRVADSPQDFAQAVTELLSSPHRRDDMARRARRLVEERYSWERIALLLEAVWNDAGRRLDQEGR